LFPKKGVNDGQYSLLYVLLSRSLASLIIAAEFNVIFRIFIAAQVLFLALLTSCSSAAAACQD
jgi:hypothetical protein